MKYILLMIIIFFHIPCMGNNLNNQGASTILVTAATGELGSAIAEQLCSEKYNIILAGRNIDKLQNLQHKLHKKYKNINISILVIDYDNLSSITKASKLIKNNALTGIVVITPRPMFNSTNIPTADEWSRVLSLTFIAPLETIRILEPNLAYNGSIVIISGLTSKTYMPNYPNSNVIRLAWTGELKNLVHYFGTRQIRVNNLSPSVILTKYNAEKVKLRSATNKTDYSKQLSLETSNIPLQHYGQVEDVANTVIFLLSNKSKYINGENIALDGGQNNCY